MSKVFEIADVQTEDDTSTCYGSDGHAEDSDSDDSKRKSVKWGSVQIVNFEEEQIQQQSVVVPAPPGLAAPTTLVLHKLAKKLDRASLVAWLDVYGFCGQYDFVHLPVSSKDGKSLRMAFVNFTSNAAASNAMSLLRCACHANWSMKHQGLEELVEYYGN